MQDLNLRAPFGKLSTRRVPYIQPDRRSPCIALILSANTIKNGWGCRFLPRGASPQSLTPKPFCGDRSSRKMFCGYQDDEIISTKTEAEAQEPETGGGGAECRRTFHQLISKPLDHAIKRRRNRCNAAKHEYIIETLIISSLLSDVAAQRS